MIETHEHTIHSDPVKWFKRAEGYLWHVIGMIGGGGGLPRHHSPDRGGGGCGTGG